MLYLKKDNLVQSNHPRRFFLELDNLYKIKNLRKHIQLKILKL